MQNEGRGWVITLWLKKNNYPPGFRVLCMNCNFSLGMRGYCPHQKEKAMSDEEMSKYGVDESLDTPDSLEKHSAKKGKCPKCGADCDMHGDVVICPNCGSEPFEEKK